MAALSARYGSELHLLRMLGRHRNFFDGKILSATNAEGVEWLDFPGGDVRVTEKKRRPIWDQEWEQLNFLPKSDRAREAWARSWPTHKGPHWDAIGRLRFFDNRFEWLLVEAKANLEELVSDCGATSSSSLTLINDAIAETKKALQVGEHFDWLTGHYQYCNRLVALNVLNQNGSPARLAYVYFYGDVGDKRRSCPVSQSEWESLLRERDVRVGISCGHPLDKRIHHIFIDARLRGTERGIPVPHYVEDGKNS
jgi:hypothetical protein